MNEYTVGEYKLVNGEYNFVSTLAGLGRNKGTWDVSHSKRTAQRLVRELNRAQSKPRDIKYYADERF
jgi:hypothetical protein